MSEPETETKPRKSTVRTVVTVVFFLLVIGFFALYLRGLEWQALAEIDIGWHWLAFGLAVGIVQRFGFPAVWVLIIKDMGVTVRNYAEYNFVYAKAWLGRYLPGKVAMVAARIYFAETLGARRSVIAVSTVMELGVQLLTAGAVGLAGIATLGAGIETIGDYRIIAYCLIGVLAFLLLPPVFNRLVHIGFYILDRTKSVPIPKIASRTVAKAVVGYLLVVCLTGAQINLVAAAIDPNLSQHYMFVWGAYSFAGVIGMVVVFAPSGLGVREAIQLPLLALVTTKELALALVVVARLSEILVDICFYTLSWAAARRALAARDASAARAD